MAMQGLVAYYYDHIRPNTTVELNQCRYNHLGQDVRYNKQPNFPPRYGRPGQCRNNNPDDICEDCMVTPSEQIYSSHYTKCRKPWSCIGTGEPGGSKPGGQRASAINTSEVHLDQGEIGFVLHYMCSTFRKMSFWGEIGFTFTHL